MEKITGVVHRVTYQNPENGYAVLKVRPNDSSARQLFDRPTDGEQTVTATGALTMFKEGDTADFLGEWKTHAKHGEFLDVQKFHLHAPTTAEGLAKFLATDYFKGIGEKTAQKLVDEFGEELPRIIEDEPSRLMDIKGVTPEKAQDIHQSWMGAQAIRDQMIALQGFGLTPNLSQKVINAYGAKAVQKLKENPYQLAYDLWGVGFQRADEIAQSLGFAHTHPNRVKAGIIYALHQAIEDGHMYLPYNELVESAAKLLALSDTELIQRLITDLRNAQVLIEEIGSGDEARLYLATYFNEEEELAIRLKELAQAKSVITTSSVKKISKLVTDFEEREKIELASQQKEVVQVALTSPVSTLTGGPGTGKSTVINTLVAVLEKLNINYLLAAPTGRAAKRLAEVTHRPASTLHRLLKLQPGEIAQYNKDNPLATDFIVVDEVSMLDVFLANHLLRAVAPGTHILLVGDADQLPSVQAGNVLHDLIASNQFPTVELKTIFRQVAGSTIVQNAHRIRSGQFPELPKDDTDFYFFEEAELEGAANMVVELVTHRIPSKFGFSARRDIQVLSPLYKTMAGVSELNRRLQKSINPAARGQAEVNFGSMIFRQSDRVMQLKNNYEKGVFNGDLGEIKSVARSGGKITISVEYPDVLKSDGFVVTYTDDEVREITLAYAVSVHKSQGSEYPVVVMPVTTSHYIMLQRNLLYTAVTRAKQLVVLVGTKRAIFIALKNDKPQLRYTGLIERLKK